MAIDQIGTPADDEPGGQRLSARLGLALSSARTVLFVVLAVIGILVVLPAAIAAQASIGI